MPDDTPHAVSHRKKSMIRSRAYASWFIRNTPHDPPGRLGKGGWTAASADMPDKLSMLGLVVKGSLPDADYSDRGADLRNDMHASLAVVR